MSAAILTTIQYGGKVLTNLLLSTARTGRADHGTAILPLKKVLIPNSRFTAPAENCPSIAPEFFTGEGVPISAIIFGGRRASAEPLICQSRDWDHGVFMGSKMSSETTAATTGAVGVVRYDPMAMLPFCGYHMGDYFQHWIDMGKKLTNPPKIFNVNWFRRDDEGNFIWPGFGDNLRALIWALERCDGSAGGVETPLGTVPSIDDLDLDGLDVDKDKLKDILTVDKDVWKKELDGIKTWYSRFDHMPQELTDSLAKLEEDLNKTKTATAKAGAYQSTGFWLCRQAADRPASTELR